MASTYRLPTPPSKAEWPAAIWQTYCSYWLCWARCGLTILDFWRSCGGINCSCFCCQTAKVQEKDAFGWEFGHTFFKPRVCCLQTHQNKETPQTVVNLLSSLFVLSSPFPCLLEVFERICPALGDHFFGDHDPAGRAEKHRRQITTFLLGFNGSTMVGYKYTVVWRQDFNLIWQWVIAELIQ